MAKKKKAKRDFSKEMKEAADARPAKQKKPPGDGKIKKELRRVFGKKLKPEFEANDEDATIVFFGAAKIGEDNVRRMLMQLLERCPASPA